MGGVLTQPVQALGTDAGDFQTIRKFTGHFSSTVTAVESSGSANALKQHRIIRQQSDSNSKPLAAAQNRPGLIWCTLKQPTSTAAAQSPQGSDGTLYHRPQYYCWCVLLGCCRYCQQRVLQLLTECGVLRVRMLRQRLCCSLSLCLCLLLLFLPSSTLFHLVQEISKTE